MSDNQSQGDAHAGAGVVLWQARLDRFNVQTNHRKPTREEALGHVPISFDVKRFAKFGGPDLSFLRGFVMNPEVRRRPYEGGILSPKDLDYVLVLENHNILPPVHEDYTDSDPGPRNLQTLLRGLLEPVAPTGPLIEFDEARYNEWKDIVQRSINDMSMLWPFFIVAGPPADQALGVTYDDMLTLTDNETEVPTPTLYDGINLSNIHPRVLNDLPKVLHPTGSIRANAVPNFIAEIKDDINVAEGLGTIEGAYGARAIQALRVYGKGFDENADPKDPGRYDGKAYTITASFILGVLRLYCHYPEPPPPADDKITYLSRHLRTIDMMETYEHFVAGLCALHNARRMTKRYRERFVRHANEEAARRDAEDRELESNDDSIVS